MAEQRYKAVMAVISEGRTITQVARDWGVSRQTMHAWLARYEADGLEGLANLSHRPAHCPHQMVAAVEVELLEMRRARPYWGARRLALELRRKGAQPPPSKSAIYRSLVRAGVIDPLPRQRRSEKWKRWERGAPMELWRLTTVMPGSQAVATRLRCRVRGSFSDRNPTAPAGRSTPRQRLQLTEDWALGLRRRPGDIA